MIANLEAKATVGAGHKAPVVGVEEGVVGDLVRGHEVEECFWMHWKRQMRSMEEEEEVEVEGEEDGEYMALQAALVRAAIESPYEGVTVERVTVEGVTVDVFCVAMCLACHTRPFRFSSVVAWQQLCGVLQSSVFPPVPLFSPPNPSHAKPPTVSSKPCRHS